MSLSTPSVDGLCVSRCGGPKRAVVPDELQNVVPDELQDVVPDEFQDVVPDEFQDVVHQQRRHKAKAQHSPFSSTAASISASRSSGPTSGRLRPLGSNMRRPDVLNNTFISDVPEDVGVDLRAGT